MDLESWRNSEALTYAKLAERIGVSQARMARRYALGEQSPRPEIVEQIRVATGGAVTPNDLHRSRVAWLTEKGLMPPVGARDPEVGGAPGGAEAAE